MTRLISALLLVLVMADPGWAQPIWQKRPWLPLPNVYSVGDADFTLESYHQGSLLVLGHSDSMAVTLPQACGGNEGLFAAIICDFPMGWMFRIINVGTGPMTITPTVSTINYETTLVLQQWESATIFSDGTNYYALRTYGTGTTTDLAGTNCTVQQNNSGVATCKSTAPAVTNTTSNSCGTSAASLVGNDTAGKVTVGATAGTSCTVTFAAAYTNAPACWCNNNVTANICKATSTTTTVILAGTFVAADVVSYGCLPY